MSKLQLNKANGKIWGVCAGLADWSGMDVTILRLIFVAAAIAGLGSPVLIYILMALILN